MLEEVSKLAPTAVPLQSVVAERDPTESLMQAVKGADLLVLGTRGRGRFGPMAIG